MVKREPSCTLEQELFKNVFEKTPDYIKNLDLFFGENQALYDMIQTMKKDLRDVIEEKHGMEKGALKRGCVGFEQYPTLVSNIPTNNAITLTTVFAYAKGDNYEVHPSGGSFNPETGEQKEVYYIDANKNEEQAKALQMQLTIISKKEILL